jgi:ectoine hydroxylase-related dioxygenase (phytanoyl-CoA dioxygenase family)
VTTATGKLAPEQVHFYEENGYLFPLRAFSEEKAKEFRQHFERYTQENEEKLSTLLPRERRKVYSQMHLTVPWVYEMVSNANVLDAVEAVIGPDIIVWDTGWFAKFPHDKAFVSWHQDGAYWGLRPPKVTTAWVAVGPSNAENGCMQVMPGTHKQTFPQTDTYAPDNALSRGQEIAVQVDESKAVNIELRPGEMSLHHIGIAHGSKANHSDYPRIGLAVRYIAAEVEQDGMEKQIAQLVRGRDDYGHFELVEPPVEGANSSAVREEADRRALRNTLLWAKK